MEAGQLFLRKVSWIIKVIFHRMKPKQWLVPSPAEHHDRDQLELLRAWEPLDSSVPPLVGEGKTPRLVFLMETTMTQKRAEKIRLSLRFDCYLLLIVLVKMVV
jgi:hypothetical protein